MYRERDTVFVHDSLSSGSVGGSVGGSVILRVNRPSTPLAVHMYSPLSCSSAAGIVS